MNKSKITKRILQAVALVFGLVGATNPTVCRCKQFESIRFDLRAVDANRTKITVDYHDRWYGMWPPFFFNNPGMVAERKILGVIWPPGEM